MQESVTRGTAFDSSHMGAAEQDRRKNHPESAFRATVFFCSRMDSG